MWVASWLFDRWWWRRAAAKGGESGTGEQEKKLKV